MEDFVPLGKGDVCDTLLEHADGTVGEPKASPIWVTQILLGRLFRERQALGRVVKLYARF